MGKKVLIGAGVAGLVLVAVGVVAFLNLNALLAQNRDRIAGLASEAAGRTVAFETASVAFSSGLAIRIDGLRVAEDPRFGKVDFLALESAFVEVALWPALQRRIEVRGVRLVRPTIQLVETSRGYNFATLGESGTKSEPSAADGETPSMALVVGALEIEDGTIVYADRTAKDGLALMIEEFESSGTNLTGEGPLALDFSGTVRPTDGDASLASALSGSLAIRDRSTGEGELHLESPSFFPLLVGVDLSEGGDRERLDDLDLTIGLPADAGKSGYPIALRTGEARLAGFDLEKIEGQLVHRSSKLLIERLTLGLAGGEAEMKGSVAFGSPGRSPFDLDLKLRALDSDELAHVLLGVPLGLVSGEIDGEIDLAGRSLDWETLSRTLAGHVKLEVGDGALEGVNVLNALTTRLVGDPGVGQFLASSLREAAPEALKGDRTPFDLLRLALELEEGRVRADDLQIAAKDFGIAASGALGLDGLLDGEGRIRFSPELSKKILKKADRFAPLLADGDVVVLPLQLGGKLSAPFLRPDLGALSSHARDVATDELKEKAAKKLTDAIFGKKKNKKKQGGDPAAGADAPAGGEPAADAADEGSADAPSPRELEREAAKDLVEEGLGRLLGN
jgi:hypothetical protein